MQLTVFRKISILSKDAGVTLNLISNNKKEPESAFNLSYENALSSRYMQELDRVILSSYDTPALYKSYAKHVARPILDAVHSAIEAQSELDTLENGEVSEDTRRAAKLLDDKKEVLTSVMIKYFAISLTAKLKEHDLETLYQSGAYKELVLDFIDKNYYQDFSKGRMQKQYHYFESEGKTIKKKAVKARWRK